MYNIPNINREIAELQCQRDRTITYWFEMGEDDRSAGLAAQYSDNPWYLSGYQDRGYQIEIGFNSENQNFDHF